MMTRTGPKVMGYNARFGDPETQSMLPLLSDDTDLCHVLLACATNKLKDVKIETRPGYACAVVVASRGYPLQYGQGYPIELAPCPKGRPPPPLPSVTPDVCACMADSFQIFSSSTPGPGGRTACSRPPAAACSRWPRADARWSRRPERHTAASVSSSSRA